MPAQCKTAEQEEEKLEAESRKIEEAGSSPTEISSSENAKAILCFERRREGIGSREDIMTIQFFRDWAGDKDDYVSTTSFLVYLGRNPIAWSSKKQGALARSSTKVEFRAVAATTAEVLWIRNLLSELGISCPHSPIVYGDNLGATHYSANPVFHSQMKYLALAFHFVREQFRTYLQI